MRSELSPSQSHGAVPPKRSARLRGCIHPAHRKRVKDGLPAMPGCFEQVGPRHGHKAMGYGAAMSLSPSGTVALQGRRRGQVNTVVCGTLSGGFPLPSLRLPYVELLPKRLLRDRLYLLHHGAAREHARHTPCSRTCPPGCSAAAARLGTWRSGRLLCVPGCRTARRSEQLAPTRGPCSLTACLPAMKFMLSALFPSICMPLAARTGLVAGRSCDCSAQAVPSPQAS